MCMCDMFLIKVKNYSVSLIMITLKKINNCYTSKQSLYFILDLYTSEKPIKL